MGMNIDAWTNEVWYRACGGSERFSIPYYHINNNTQEEILHYNAFAVKKKTKAHIRNTGLV